MLIMTGKFHRLVILRTRHQVCYYAGCGKEKGGHFMVTRTANNVSKCLHTVQDYNTKKIIERNVFALTKSSCLDTSIWDVFS